uniref:Uncharacterized protein n=1 Tax=Arundo donax TaxID=35708 RepID=A0A0A8Z264_ARUDO
MPAPRARARRPRRRARAHGARPRGSRHAPACRRTRRGRRRRRGSTPRSAPHGTRRTPWPMDNSLLLLQPPARKRCRRNYNS